MPGLQGRPWQATREGSRGERRSERSTDSAARVRGVGLKTGGRFWVEGLHQSTHQSEEISCPFCVVSHFDLLGYAPEVPEPTRLTLTVRFRVTVPADGRVTIAAEAVELLPDSSPAS